MSAIGMVTAVAIDHASTMKAIAQSRYGSPDVLQLTDVPVPTVGDDSVLVRVRASSVNALDWHYMRGEPYLVRLSEGLRRPKANVRGVDVAGEVEAVGTNVTHLKPGDAVFGLRDGAWAEYVSGRTFAPKPANLTFERAAAIPVAATTALQALRNKGQIKSGQRVLVTGAGGGVGTFAVQIAKAFGAEVTAATSTQHLDLVHSIGADRIFDYSREDYTAGSARYDLICDIGGNRSLGDLGRVMTPDGTLVVVGGVGAGRWLGPLIRPIGAVLRYRFGHRRMLPFLSHPDRDDLLVLTGLIEAGKVTPVIDRTYALSDAAEAIRYLETGKVKGKVVIAV